MVQRRVQQTNKSQLTLTIPKTFAELLGYSRTTVLSFSLDKERMITLKRAKHANKSTRMKVQRTANRQYTITIPKQLATALGIKKGDTLSFGLSPDLELIIKK
ncbi:MAG: AbrB/MazE/SpoVT family DNA-binding domain-containing protein [Nanobdellota archaeon]